MPQSDGLRRVAAGEGGPTTDGDARCFTVLQDDSSRSVTETRVEYNDVESHVETGAQPQVALPSASRALTGHQRAGFPATSVEALRLAITLAVDEGNYDDAAVLLEVVLRTRR